VPPVRAGQGADFAACRDGRRGGPPSREGVYGLSRRTRQVLSTLLDRFFNLIHKLWISRGRLRLLAHRRRPSYRRRDLCQFKRLPIARLSTIVATGSTRHGGKQNLQSPRIIDEPDAQRLPDEKDFRTGWQAREVAKLAMREVSRLVTPEDGDGAPAVIEPDGVRPAMQP
jgi:hypothetical protein